MWEGRIPRSKNNLLFSQVIFHCNKDPTDKIKVNKRIKKETFTQRSLRTVYRRLRNEKKPAVLFFYSGNLFYISFNNITPHIHDFLIGPGFHAKANELPIISQENKVIIMKIEITKESNRVDVSRLPFIARSSPSLQFIKKPILLLYFYKVKVRRRF